MPNEFAFYCKKSEHREARAKSILTGEKVFGEGTQKAVNDII